MRSPVPSIVSASLRRPVLTALAGLLLAALALFHVTRDFAMSTDTGDLISDTVDWRQQDLAMKRAFPQLRDLMLIVVDGRTPELAEDGAARLTAALSADKAHFERVTRPDGGDFFAREGLLFRPADDVRKTTDSLIAAQPMLGPLAADPSLRGVSTALSTMLDGVERGDASLSDIAAPVSALADTMDALIAGKPAFFSWMNLLDTDSATAAPTRRLVLVRPVMDFGSLKPAAGAAAAVDAAARSLRLDEADGVRIRMTGDAPLADEEFSTLEENIGAVAMVMLGAMLLTLWLATRSAKLVAAIMLTIVAGLVVTTALGLLAVGRFNLISVAFIPLFVGLGVDFGIQISVRFNAERADGADTPEALRRAATALGVPLLLAAGAIFLGFAAFLPTAYVGIAELGIISGIGMVVALAFSLTLLPAIIALLRPGAPGRDVGLKMLAPVERLLERRRRAVLWTFAAAMLGTIAMLPWVVFDFNPFHLRNPDGPAMATLSDLTRDPDRTPNSIDVLARDEGDAARLKPELAALPEVSHVVSVDSFVPADQPEKLAMIDDAAMILDLTFNPLEVAAAPDDAALSAALSATAAKLKAAAAADRTPAAAAAFRLAADFDTLAKGSPALRERADATVSRPLAVMLDQTRAMLSAEPVERASLPSDLVRDWVAPNGRMRLSVYPSGDPDDNDTLRRFRDAVAGVTPAISGMPVATQAAAGTVGWAFVQAGVLGFLLVSLLLFLVLRDVREVLFTLAPVVLSIFLTLGTCILIGQPINFANIIAFPLLFGVGVAFHIYFVMAWRHGTTALLTSSLARAILFSALATGTAFGALWLSNHPGTASMGKVLMISLAWTLVCALIFEPALLGPVRAKK